MMQGDILQRITNHKFALCQQMAQLFLEQSTDYRAGLTQNAKGRRELLNKMERQLDECERLELDVQAYNANGLWSMQQWLCSQRNMTSMVDAYERKWTPIMAGMHWAPVPIASFMIATEDTSAQFV